MNAPGRPYPRSAVYIGGEMKHGFCTPFNYGQTGTAHFDPSYPAYLVFVPDGEPSRAYLVMVSNLYMP